MAKRLIDKFFNDELEERSSIYYDPEWQEFVVKFWQHGEYQANADYFTNDKADAILTAKALIAST